MMENEFSADGKVILILFVIVVLAFGGTIIAYKISSSKYTCQKIGITNNVESLASDICNDWGWYVYRYEEIRNQPTNDSVCEVDVLFCENSTNLCFPMMIKYELEKTINNTEDITINDTINITE